MAVTLEGGFPVVFAGPGLSSITQSVTVGAGANRLLVVMFSCEVVAEGLTSCTFGGVGLTKLDDDQATSFGRTQIWYLIAPATSTANVVGNFTGSSGGKGIAIYVFDGVDQVTPLSTAGKAHADSGTTNSVTPSGFASGDWTVDILSLDSTGHTPVVTGANVGDYAVTADGGNEFRGSSNTTSGVMPWSWTTSTANSHIAAIVKQLATAAAVGSAPVFRPMLLALRRFAKPGRPRLGFPQLAPDFGVAAVTENCPQGGALAAGFGPVVQVTTPQGGALAAGNAPAPSVAVAQGGAAASGNAPTVTTTVAQGGAAAQGFTPIAQAPVPQGGATAQGTTTTIRVAVPQGGATAQGNAPTPATAVAQGGALAQGFGPAARVDVGRGGATAGGQLTDPLAGGTSEMPPPGGALAQGLAPVPKVAVVQGGALAQGTTATVRVAAVPGGALAQGTSPSVQSALVISGATAAGRAITLALVPLSPGGAIAGGQLTDPQQVFVTAFFDQPSPLGGMDPGTPGAALYDQGSPSGGVDPGNPTATEFDSPRPRKVRA
jgi:hypothetical protein